MKSVPFKFVLIGMLLLVAVAAELFVYNVYSAPRRQAAQELGRLTQILRQEAKRAAPKAESLPDGGSSIPLLLGRVQDVAGSNGVMIRSLAPEQDKTDQFQMDIAGNFPDIVRFLAEFEALNVAIVAFQIDAPKEGEETDGLLNGSFKFAHTAAQSPGRLAYIENFALELVSMPIRDPFSVRGASQAVLGENDLTWTHNLTSISTIGATRYATIDAASYGIGDVVMGKTIKAIGTESVTLAGPDDMKYIVRFRSLPGRQL